jgi:hypothetical protein
VIPQPIKRRGEKKKKAAERGAGAGELIFEGE